MYYARSWSGFGQTRSWHCSGQNSLILSNRHHCRSSVRPCDTNCSGKSDALHEVSFSKLMVLQLSVVLFRTLAFPGKSRENQKWCIWVMPFKVVFTVLSSKNLPQSYIGTITSPFCVPTN